MNYLMVLEIIGKNIEIIFSTSIYTFIFRLTNFVEDLDSFCLSETGVILVSAWPAARFFPLDNNVGLLNCFKSQFSGWLIFIRPFLSK